MTTSALTALVSADLPPPTAGAALTRMAARRAAITALGGADELHGLTTERLVQLAAARSMQAGRVA